LEPDAAEAQKMLQARGATLTAGQASTSSVLDTAENVARNSILGRPIMQRTLKQSYEAARANIDDFALTLHATTEPHVRAKFIQAAVEGNRQGWLGAASAKYEAVDDMLRNQGLTHVGVVDTTPLKVFINKEASKYPLKGSAGGLAKLRALQKEVNNLPPSITFKRAHYLRSQLGGQTPEPGTATNILGGVYKKMFGIVDEGMNEAGMHGDLPPAILATYRDAQSFYAQGAETFNNDFIQRMVGLESPEVLYEAAVKDARPTNILRLRAALKGSPDFDVHWNNIQGQWFGEALRRSERMLPDGGRTLDGTRLLQELDSLGPAAEGALFGGRGLTPAKRLARSLQLAQKEPGGGTGAMAIQLMQPGAAIYMVSRPFVPEGDARTAGDIGAASILLGPAVIAVAFKDARFVNYLTQGLEAPVGSAAASRAFGNLLARADQLGILDKPIDTILGARKPPTVQEQQEQRRGTAMTAGELLRRRIFDKSLQ